MRAEIFSPLRSVFKLILYRIDNRGKMWMSGNMQTVDPGNIHGPSLIVAAILLTWFVVMIGDGGDPNVMKISRMILNDGAIDTIMQCAHQFRLDRVMHIGRKMYRYAIYLIGNLNKSVVVSLMLGVPVVRFPQVQGSWHLNGHSFRPQRGIRQNTGTTRPAACAAPAGGS